MTKRTEKGFPHSPEAIPGVEAKTTRHADGNVTVTFGDGSDPLKVDRREFMRLSSVAAATVAMSTAACRNPVEHIVPYVDRPESIRIGQSNYFASVCGGCSSQCGILVQTRSGRPIKLEGNPQHPASQGGLCARGQASYLGLYEPGRAETPLNVVENGTHRPLTWDEVDGDVKGAITTAANGGGVALLTETLSGSGRNALIKEIQGSVKGFKHYEYEPLNSEAMLAAGELAYSVGSVPHYRFDRADMIVSFGSDFLGTWLSPTEFSKQFSSRRNPDGRLNKLVAFEGQPTITGMNADERFRARPSDYHIIALGLAHVVAVTREVGGGAAIRSAVSPFTPQAVSDATGVPADVITRVGQSLADAAGKSIVVAGGLASATTNGVALEVAVAMLNSVLGNDGITLSRARPSMQAEGRFGALAELIADIDAGKVDVLIIDGANPVYSAPRSLKFAEALNKVKLVVSTSNRVDETSRFAKYLAPAGTSFETWGDSVPFAGVFSIQQPSVRPLYDTRALETSLMVWFADVVPSLKPYLEPTALPAGNNPGGATVDAGAAYRYFRAHWESEIFPLAKSTASFDQFWDDTLRQGVFVSAAGAVREPQFNPRALAELPKQAPAPKALPVEDLAQKEIQLVAIAAMYDGKLANNGHLQELPDPVTKHVWGSYVCVSPKTFKAVKLEQGQYIEFKFDGIAQRYPVIMQPGLHDDVIAVPVGYGRTAAGEIADEVGENAFQMTRLSEDRKRQLFDPVGVEVSKTRDGEEIAIEQGAQVINLHRRPIIALTTLEEYRKDASAGKHTHPDLLDMWEAHDYPDRKWGMSIDLTKCTGCSACVIACQEENNIPTVGRQGVLEGRAMHWMRIDRYYVVPHAAAHLEESITNDPMIQERPVEALAEYMDNPVTVVQPMLCQQCENAPCETVCPVSATMHSSDGLNQMIYNRCVGTRYCSNNCPFKVRRFNWFNYVDNRIGSIWARIYPEIEEHSKLNAREPMQKALNPDVTVRARGVMEKCTFCVQRIRQMDTRLRKEGRSAVRAGDVLTACQQTCPSDAIQFGNLVDPDSVVAKAHASKRAVSPLAEVGVGSSIAYLSNVKNRAPEPDHGHDDTHSDHG